MTTIGLIVEYNPFHNGHLYHLQEAGKAFPGSRIICVMSGNWVQRGEPAVFNKWARAHMALKGGADVVLELPTVYALQSADRFAFGAIHTLLGCGGVSHLCFGSELGEIEPLKKMAALLAKEPPRLKALLKDLLAAGNSYPAALCQAAADYWCDEEMGRIISSPNNILGIEYLKHLLKAPSDIVPFTILRHGTGYHSLDLQGSIASATAVRKGLREENDQAYQALPPFSREIISREISTGRGPVFWESLGPALMAQLRRAGIKELSALPDMEEGLAQRFFKTCRTTSTLQEFLAQTATKRYTFSRLRRILCYLYLGLSRRDLDAFNKSGPQYLRLLGFSPRGREVLHTIKKQGLLPLITRPAKYFRHSPDKMGKKMLAMDLKGADLYNLLYPSPQARRGAEDFAATPLQKKPPQKNPS